MKKLFLLGVLGACTWLHAAGMDGVIAYWPFGDQGLNDASGHGNTLEADVNVTIGETAVMNGAHRLFSTVNALDLSACEAVTIEFWVKFNASDNSSATRMLFELSPNVNTNPGGFYVDLNEAAPGALMGMYHAAGGSSGADEYPLVGFGDGEWHHVAFVMRPRVAGEACSMLYIDKEHVYTHCNKYSFANNSGYVAFPSAHKLFIGSRSNSTLQFKGELDNIRVTGRALAPWAFLNRDGTSDGVSLVGYWPFGSAGLADMSGNGHDLLFEAGGVFTNGAVAFAGTGSPLSSRLPIDLRPYTLTGLTAEFWMRMPTGADASGSRMMFELSQDSSLLTPGSSAFYVDVGESGTSLLSMMRMDLDGGYHIDENRTADLHDDTWHHVAMVYDPQVKKGVDTVRLYLDGVKQNQNIAANYSRSNLTELACAHLFIGGRSGGQYLFNGELDDVRLTAYPLDPEQFMTERTEEDVRVAGWWQFCRAAPTASYLPGGPALAASGSVVYSNGVAVLTGAGSLAPVTPLALADAPAVTAECFVNVDGSWRHLVKTWTNDVEFTLATVKLDDAAVSDDDWADVLVLANGAFTAARTGFTGMIDDVRVTVAAPESFALLASRSDDTPQVLAHWGFDHYQGVNDNTGVYTLAPSASPLDYLIVDSACQIRRGMGFRSIHPLLLARWPTLTLECFARFDAGSRGTIFELGDNYNNFSGTFDLSARMFTASGPGFGLRTSGGYNIRALPQATTDGAWHHYACVYDRSGNAVRTAFYVDGVAVDNWSGYANTAATPLRDAKMTIASRWGVGENTAWEDIPSFVGDIDEIRIVNAALTPSEMMQPSIRTAQTARTLAHWTFDGEQPLADKSGNGHDLIGTATAANGVASFANGTSLNSAEAFPFSNSRQLTVEMVFRRTVELSGSAMLYESGLDYNKNHGTICSYLNFSDGQNHDLRGSLDIATYGLARRSDDACVKDTHWHRLVVWYDMDAPFNGGMRCTGLLDGKSIRASMPRNDWASLEARPDFTDQIFYLGSRGGTGVFFTGEMKEVRISDGLVPVSRLLECPATETEDHVVAYWPFSGNSRGLQDATGNGHDLATPSSGVSILAKNDYAEFMEGHGALTTAGTINFDALDAFTVECFLRMPDNDGTQSYGILGTAVTYAQQKTGFNFSMTLGDNPNQKIGVAVPVCGGFRSRYTNGWFYPQPILKGGVLTDRQWHHMALVVDRTAGQHGQVSYYFDGRLVQSANLPDDVVFTAERLAIGSVLGGEDAGKFVGQIDDVRISSAALAPAQFLSRRTLPLGCTFIVR